MRALFVLCVSAYALAACGDPAVRITKRVKRPRTKASPFALSPS